MRRRTVKKILGVYGSPRPHWVGDGFPVRSLLSYETHGRHISPFLLADYAGPQAFPPAAAPRGVRGGSGNSDSPMSGFSA
jgi:quercetin 2,3-dioxygenase